MQKALRVRIYPNREQRVFLQKTFGCCRFVWNTLLDRSIKDYEVYKEDNTLPRPNVSGISFVKSLTPLKQEKEFLSEVATEALQQKLLDLGKSYQNFFNGKGYPQFRSRRSEQKFRLMSRYFSVKDNKLIISRCKTPIKVKWDKRGLPTNPSQVTISLDKSGRYHASFLHDVEPTRRCGTGVVGIDLGLKDLMTLSTGEVVPNPRHHNKHAKRLRREHQNLSRKVKGSNNRNKQRPKLARAYARCADTRSDHLHKLTTRLINENQVICLEHLRVKNMMANPRLARHIGDASWGMLISMLHYKAVEANASIRIVNTWYPSTQTCSACNHRLTGDAKLKLQDRIWTCPRCDTTHDRDVNASINILQYGLTLGDMPNGTIIADQP